MIVDVPVYRSPDEPAPADRRDRDPRPAGWIAPLLIVLALTAIVGAQTPLGGIAAIGLLLVLAIGLGRWIGLWGLLLPLPFAIWWVVFVAQLDGDDEIDGLLAFLTMFPIGGAIVGILAGAYLHGRARARER